MIAPRSYFPELDGVRAIAIMMVMIFHLAQAGIRIPGPTVLGQSGVDLFFVLSGFLITGILLKAKQNDWGEVRTFYIRRTLRIFPLYYAVLLLLIVFGRPASFVFWTYLQNLWIAFGAPVQGPNHFWSLAVEEQFYMVWPFVVLFMPRRFLRTTLLVMIGAAILCRVPLIAMGASPFYFTLSRVDALACGGLLALLQSRRSLSRYRPHMVVMLLVSLAVLGLLTHHIPAAIEQTVKFTAFAIAYTTAIGLLLVSGRNWLTRCLSSAPLRSVGRISYGLYVFHPFAFGYALDHLPHRPQWMQAFAGVALAYGCSLLSWYGIERRLIGLKDKLAPVRPRFPQSAPPMTAL